MDNQRQSRAPIIIAVVLLLLPVLYVGSYLALVQPPTHWRMGTVLPNYRIGYSFCRRIYWPLEQIDRESRPDKWEWDARQVPL
jgi:hypothetical protein